MGNARSSYERYEDDEKQQQRVVVGKEFRLILGQLDLIKEKKISLDKKQHRKLSSSSLNSTITSCSSSDQQHSSVSFLLLDIPTSPFDFNEFDTHTLTHYLLHYQSDGKELLHLFKIPSSTPQKSQSKTLPTQQVAAIYYDQTSMTDDLYIERLSLLEANELEEKVRAKNLLSICTSKSFVYLIYNKNTSVRNEYKLIHSKTTFESLEWLEPFVDYSALGYRLCGIIPSVKSESDTPTTISWLFESNETIAYDCCVFEYLYQSFSWKHWTSFLALMSKQDWKLVITFNYYQKKKQGEQLYFLLFFQRSKNEQDFSTKIN